MAIAMNPVKKGSAFKQISVSTAFLDAVSTAAQASGRSPAKELEHAFLIAQAIEHVLPAKSINEIKQGSSPSLGFFNDLLNLLANPAKSTVLQSVLNNSSARVGQDPNDPTKIIRTYPDGRTESLDSPSLDGLKINQSENNDGNNYEGIFRRTL